MIAAPLTSSAPRIPELAYRMSAAFLAGFPSSAPAWAVYARKCSPEFTSSLAIGSWLIRETGGTVYAVNHETKLAHPVLRTLPDDALEAIQ